MLTRESLCVKEERRTIAVTARRWRMLEKLREWFGGRSSDPASAGGAAAAGAAADERGDGGDAGAGNGGSGGDGGGSAGADGGGSSS
jgi:hypothetical protein